MKTRNKKKVFAGNLSQFFRKSGEDQKKGLRRKLLLFYPKLGGGLGLFRLIIQRSNLDGGTPKSRWGTLNLDGGTLTLDGGTRPPYNLSTGNITYKFIRV